MRQHHLYCVAILRDVYRTILHKEIDKSEINHVRKLRKDEYSLYDYTEKGELTNKYKKIDEYTDQDDW